MKNMKVESSAVARSRVLLERIRRAFMLFAATLSVSGLTGCAGPVSEQGTRSLADRLVFKAAVIEDENYHIWGSSPIWGNDGRVHVFAARWPVLDDPKTRNGFDYWDVSSEIAHYVADRPEGPYTFVKVLLKPGMAPEGAWNSGTQHNPSITKIGDEFVLVYITNRDEPGETGTMNRQESRKIGMLRTKDLNGEWEDMGCILSAPEKDDTAAWSYPLRAAGRGVDNPALLHHPDGKFYLYYRAKWPGMEGENTYSVAIADKLEGPYAHYDKRLINNTRYIEDPCVFMDGDQVCLLVTDNHRYKGLLLRSDDALNFDFQKAEEGFHVPGSYMSWRKVEEATAPRARKFERPQLLLKDGSPTHLFVASGFNINKGPGTCCCIFKITN